MRIKDNLLFTQFIVCFYCSLLLTIMPQLPHYSFFLLDLTLHSACAEAKLRHFSNLNCTQIYSHRTFSALLSPVWSYGRACKNLFVYMYLKNQINLLSHNICLAKIIQSPPAPQLEGYGEWDSVLVLLAPLTHCSAFSKQCQCWEKDHCFQIWTGLQQSPEWMNNSTCQDVNPLVSRHLIDDIFSPCHRLECFKCSFCERSSKLQVSHLRYLLELLLIHFPERLQILCV